MPSPIGWTMPQPRHSRLADYRIGSMCSTTPLCPWSAPVKKVLNSTPPRPCARRASKLEEGWPAGLDPAVQVETYRYMVFTVMASFSGPEDVAHIAPPPPPEIPGPRRWTRWPSPRPIPFSLRPTLAVAPRWRCGRIIFRTARRLPAAYRVHNGHRARPQRAHGRAPRRHPGRRAQLHGALLFWMTPATLNGLPATVAPVGLTPDGVAGWTADSRAITWKTPRPLTSPAAWRT